MLFLFLFFALALLAPGNIARTWRHAHWANNAARKTGYNIIGQRAFGCQAESRSNGLALDHGTGLNETWATVHGSPSRAHSKSSPRPLRTTM
eukprot:500406-Lingulodinium_polyedra.AAC.1